METPETPNHVGFFQSNTARLIMVGLLTFALLIPLLFVQNLIEERSQRQKEVISETSGKWGESVYFYGPIVKVPYKAFSEIVTVDEKTKVATTQKSFVTDYAYFFPETLKNQSKVTTTTLNRSTYESTVFTANMAFSGHYGAPDFSPKNIADTDIEWGKATILIQTTNLKSIRNEVKINLGGKMHTFEPVYNSENDSIQALETGFFDASVLKNTGNLPFKFDIVYNGSQQIKIVPIGKTTEAHMTSNWPSPSFTGNFLPGDATKKITDQGFSADWKVLHLNRAFGQQAFEVLPNLAQYAFGVDFIIPVNQYQQNDRAAKYGFLVIGLTFLIFFLIQVISKVRIHIFQYTMIGLALVMFYTLLISITEHSSFGQAYLIAGTSVVLLISLYSVSILKNYKFPLFIAASLSVLYTFIYVIIQLEDFALLFGSIGLFLILAAVMYFSRKIDWNKS
ncbi:cell envelope integrity protein CreD [Flavobacterium sp.]|uniref:cell envelope integrity protein CreD n=1 Tax=Flavobacterium sp. TaxID=239 RepID=UPI0039E529F4